MKELYIIRHGLAGIRMEDAAHDESRPLTAKGKDKMKDIAKGLKELGVSFDKVLTSPLARAEQTADVLKKYCVDGGHIEVTDLLKPGTSKDDLIRYLNKLDADSVAIVGHEPDLGEFASYCLSKSQSSFIILKKGGVMKLEMDGPVKPGKCGLCWLMEPYQLIGLS
jgi:phosphohistidine phosphatase